MAESFELRRVLAKNIRAAVVRKGTTVVALAGLADVSAGHLYDVIGSRKAATVDFIEKIAAALDVEPAELLQDGVATVEAGRRGPRGQAGLRPRRTK